jgi:hypothetical protein
MYLVKRMQLCRSAIVVSCFIIGPLPIGEGITFRPVDCSTRRNDGEIANGKNENNRRRGWGCFTDIQTCEEWYLLGCYAVWLL